MVGLTVQPSGISGCLAPVFVGPDGVGGTGGREREPQIQVAENLRDLPRIADVRVGQCLLAVSSTLNAAFASPCNVLASRSRAAVAMACASRIPGNAIFPRATLWASSRVTMGLFARDGLCTHPHT